MLKNTTIKDDYLKNLNRSQYQAVTHTKGPLLVLAGAGAGKTKVITHRITHLIHKGVSPTNILAVTFTNKAAKEMSSRVHDLVNSQPFGKTACLDEQPTITTFHSLGVRLLREFHNHINLSRHFSIYDRSDSLQIIKKSLELADYNPKEFEPKKILSVISNAKNKGLNQESFQNQANSFLKQVASAVWKHYQEIMIKEQALDFDDLLSKTLMLLKNDPEIKQLLRNRYRYIHVDEYQDTNQVQFNLIKILAKEHQNICAVGDIDQNIYSWRGADIKNVLQFEKSFNKPHIVLLEENYRSTKNIIAAANDVIKKNQNRIDKNVFTNNSEGEKISLFVAMNEHDEAQKVAYTCRQLLKDKVAANKIAILYRANFQSRVLEESFLKLDLPYQLIGTKFFARKEIKDVLSYLRLAFNPDSQSDLSRIINVPSRGIGKVTLLKLLSDKKTELNRGAKAKVDSFYKLINEIKIYATDNPLEKTLEFIIKQSGIEKDLLTKKTEESSERLGNLYELVNLSKNFSDLPTLEAVESLLETAALQSDQDEIENREAIRMMTIHAAKGLEFPYVFIVGMEEGLFPYERLSDNETDQEEERRLFYVALTRAEKKVFLSYAHMRTIFGSQRINTPSSFIYDIDEQYIEKENPNEKNINNPYETTIYLD